MKHFFFLVCILNYSFIGFSQESMLKQLKEVEHTPKTSNYSEKDKKSSKKKATKAFTTIWSDDFSDTTNWIYSGGLNEWEIRDSLPSNLLAQNFDSVLNSTSGGNFGFINSDIGGSGSSQDASIEYNGSIDCSSFLGVRLHFETYLRQYKETREVLVSNDGGATWVTYVVLNEFTTNTNSPNVYTEMIDISATAGGEADVRVKFHYVGNWDWFWCVDDVRLTSIPDNDVAFSGPYFHNSKLDSNIQNYYQKIPEFLAKSNGVKASSTLSNEGITDQTNVRLQWDWKGPTTNTTIISLPTSISVGDKDSVLVNNTNKLGDDGQGVYEWTFYTKSDSVDENPDTVVHEIEVTDTTYARGTQMGGNNWWNGFEYEIGPMFEIFDTAKVTSVSVGFGSLTKPGNVFSINIYDADFNKVASREFIAIDSSDVGVANAFSIPQTILNPGMYIVTMRVYSDSTFYSQDPSVVADPQTVLVDPDATGSWFWTTSVPVIQLNVTDDLFLCNITCAAFQSDSNEATVTVVGGTTPYTYVWSTGDSTEVVTGLDQDSTYTVYVIDADSCVSNTSSVNIVSGTSDLTDNRSIRLFPNPNEGHFVVEVDGSMMVDEIQIYDPSGRLVFNRTWSHHKIASRQINLSLDSGMYLVLLKSDEGNWYQQKMIVK